MRKKRQLLHQVSTHSLRQFNANITLFLGIFLLVLSMPAFGQEEVEVLVSEFSDHELRTDMENNASELFNEMNRAFSEGKELELSNLLVSDSTKGTIQEIWENSHFYIPEQKIIETVSKRTSGFFEMRNIPVFFVDANGEEYYEEAVIQFSQSGQIRDFRIGIAAHRYRELMRQGEDVIDIENRQSILTFVENFRTAYNRRDITLLNNVFSDKALIIVGKVIENTGERSAFEDQVVEFLQFTKEEYIERLRRLFEVNEWIEVGFEEIGIIRHPRFDDVYGVSLTQYYNSSIYSDVGYLFLLIDFEEPEQPTIHVRTWQPKRSTPENEKYTIGDFHILD